MIPPLFAIYAFPLVVLALFRACSPQKALVWSLLAGYLFLPTGTGLDLPLLPALDKDSVPALVSVACLLALGAGRLSDPAQAPLPGWLPRHPLILLMISGVVLGAFLTVVTNRDALVYGEMRLPGLRLYDGFSAVLSVLVNLLPFVLARRYLASDASQQMLLRALCAGGLIYSVPIVYEVVMSPQMNNMVYGFFPHSWRQHIRDGGFRPIVFLHHGLRVGIFICVSVLAAAAWTRLDRSPRKNTFAMATAWLFLILLLCKTLGAFAIALALLPAVLLLRPRAQLMVAALLAGTILVYPALRGAGVIPVDRVVSLATQINADRAGSLIYRLMNEEMLLEKANQRPLFGWGGWGRARVYDESGRDISTTDGSWIIVIGTQGWLGYLSLFGLLCGPILLLFLRKRDNGLTPTTAALGLVLAANLVDLIPNSGLTPVTWLLVGALAGRLEAGAVAAMAPGGVPAAPARDRAMRFTRFGGPSQTPPPRSSDHGKGPSRHRPPGPSSRRKDSNVS